MRTTLVLLWILRWTVFLIGIPVYIISIAFFFAGGWFTAPAYYFFYEAVRNLQKDMREAYKTADDTSFANTADFALAHTRVDPKAPYYESYNNIPSVGDLRGIHGFDDFGYNAPASIMPQLVKRCPVCRTDQSPESTECRYCNNRLNDELVSPVV